MAHNLKGADHPGWKGGHSIHSEGYVLIKSPGHPRAAGGYVLEHILIVEKALRKPLSAKHPIHHFNGNAADNSRGNLVVCESQAYHLLLHVRQRVKNAGGNPNTDGLCCTCRETKPLSEFSKSSTSKSGHHGCCRSCNIAYCRQYNLGRRTANAKAA